MGAVLCRNASKRCARQWKRAGIIRDLIQKEVLLSLIALTEAADVAAAFAALTRHFANGEVVEGVVGFTGGSQTVPVRWFPAEKLWAYVEPEKQQNRLACAFGIQDPGEAADPKPELNIVCEINPPREGIDRRSATVFVRSRHGAVYLAHSGKVGGGRTGVGKIGFLKFYGDDTVDTVQWPDDHSAEYIVIAALDDNDFREQVAAFVHKVADFKDKAATKPAAKTTTRATGRTTGKAKIAAENAAQDTAESAA